MSSCEQFITIGTRKTTNVCLKDIMFVNNRGGLINKRSDHIYNAAVVSLTFREQKNGEKWETNTQEATTDPLLKPVRLLACVVSELWKLTGTTGDTLTCTFYDQCSACAVSSTDALEHLRGVAEVLGKDKL